MESKLEVVPVSDVDRAKDFYERMGFREDIDFAAGDGYRVVQLTPPGSACSIIFGKGVTSAQPGSSDRMNRAAGPSTADSILGSRSGVFPYAGAGESGSTVDHGQGMSGQPA